MRCNNPEMEEKVACYNLLSDEEKHAVDAHLEQCPACARDRGLDQEINAALLKDRHVAPTDLIEYALQKKKISRRKRLEIENHLNACSECRLEAWLTRDSKQDFVEREQPFFPYIRTFIFSPAVSLALAGVVLLLLPYLAFKTISLQRDIHEITQSYQSKVTEVEQQAEKTRTDYARLDQEHREVLEPQIGTPLLKSIEPPMRSGRPGEPTGRPIVFRFSRHAKSHTSVISLPPGQHDTYKVQIYQSGKRIWTGPIQLQNRALSLTMHEKTFDAGEYTLKIYETNQQQTLVVNCPLIIIKD